MTPFHSVQFRFADGSECATEVRAGQSVLDAGLAAGVPLLHQCRSGSCSTCVARLVDGDAQTMPGCSATLLRSEVEAGQRLLCVTAALSDCRFELPYARDVGAQPVVEAHALVDAVERISSNVVRLSVTLAEDSWLACKPGQYVQVEVPGVGVMRSYSPVTTAADLPRMDFLIRLLPEGAMSDWLRRDARVDDVLRLSGPHGSFFLREQVRAPHIFVAGGTGLAPVLAMIDRLRQLGGRTPPVLLAFGCAAPEQLFHLDELDLRRHWMPRLEARICVDQGAGEGQFAGSPVAALQPGDVTDPATVAYLCGPQGMIDAAREGLRALGLPADQMYSEQFVPSH